MISFVVIGKNEGQKLTKCFQSIYKTLELNQLTDFEILYIDSNSTDDSIQRALFFNDILVYKLTKLYNPAIARNIGASKSKGDILVFIDGDMEINPEFFKKAITNSNLVKPIIAGTVVDRIIDSKGNILQETEYHKKDKPYFKLITGGAFIINKEIWDMVGGMDNRFVKSADPELGLRLAKKGYLQYCIPEVFVYHNNDKYETGNRLQYSGLFKAHTLYSSVLMFRKNLFSKYTLHKIIGQEKSLLMLVISILITIFTGFYLVFFLYIIVLVMRALKQKNLRLFFKRVIYFFLRDIISLFGYFLFFPKRIHLSNIPVQNYKSL